jgi:hypothetical protein
MSILPLNQPISAPNNTIASTLRRLASWLETPPAPVPDKRRLPKDLADAEDWLLEDLGLAEPADCAPPRSTIINAIQS